MILLDESQVTTSPKICLSSLNTVISKQSLSFIINQQIFFKLQGQTIVILSMCTSIMSTIFLFSHRKYKQPLVADFTNSSSRRTLFNLIFHYLLAYFNLQCLLQLLMKFAISKSLKLFWYLCIDLLLKFFIQKDSNNINLLQVPIQVSNQDQINIKSSKLCNKCKSLSEVLTRHL